MLQMSPDLQEYEDKMQEMQTEMEMERTNRGKLQADMDKLRAFYDTKLKSVDGQLADLPPTSAGKNLCCVLVCWFFKGKILYF